MRHQWILLILGVLLFACVTALGQTNQAAPTSATSKVDLPSNLIHTLTAAAPTEKDSARVIASQADYAIWANDFRRRTYENQLVQTRIIFVVVLLLVLAGLFFSWIQFQHSLRMKAPAKGHTATDQATATGAPTDEEIRLGREGIVIHSAYLGVIILAISMAFFFLYLRFVYPITMS
jgi:hypothetical protein